MRAKFIYEAINFERGGNPLDTLDIGLVQERKLNKIFRKMQGIAMEYDYLTENGCPNNGGPKEVLEQTIDYDDKESIYDVLTVECQDGEIIEYYFNIDSFFGKWE